MRSSPTTLAALTLAALLTTGCGSDNGSGDPPGSASDPSGAPADQTDGASSGGTPTEDPAAVPTIGRKSFCDQLAPADISAIGGDKKPAKLLTDRKPGEAYEIFDTKRVEDSWNCYWSSERTGYNLQISGEPTTAQAVEQQVKGSEKLGNKDTGTCTSSDVTGFGNVAYGLSCVRKEVSKAGTFSSGYAQASRVGLFGDVKVYCEVSSSDDTALARIEAAVADFCALGLDAMSS